MKNITLKNGYIKIKGKSWSVDDGYRWVFYSNNHVEMAESVKNYRSSSECEAAARKVFLETKNNYHSYLYGFIIGLVIVLLFLFING